MACTCTSAFESGRRVGGPQLIREPQRITMLHVGVVFVLFANAAVRSLASSLAYIQHMYLLSDGRGEAKCVTEKENRGARSMVNALTHTHKYGAK